eukprot:CAMPEP_0201883686 /NCGR_PEP_ID=MMETSP0902-20130614/16181_1 /ASSEMBLY_ACC=CAM_ASM_000551 /TAXON_ID=420261 /ORGANISM="Thalassiosira antarctica, Strain CCMP982" /LENGTH=218 /DNA_ID=CAMNT_0048412537 /DNA_START=69 /DNA_END=725 /DNA_ORIENTATION=-
MARHSLLLLASALSTAPPTTISAFSTAARSSIAFSPSRAISSSTTSLNGFFGNKGYAAPCVMGEESIMSPKAHGTSATPVQKDLRWDCDNATADKICNFNRHYAEHAGYWTTTSFVGDVKDEKGEITFYDSNSGKPLFVAPKGPGRDMEGFLKESSKHGWPSFRDEEVIWENVRCLGDGETVSVDGTHLGHNLPDGTGNRYCINLVCVAGRPEGEEKE